MFAKIFYQNLKNFKSADSIDFKHVAIGQLDIAVDISKKCEF